MKRQLKTMQALPPLALATRIQRLKALARAIRHHQQQVAEAINRDFSHRSTEESLLAEIMVCLEEIKHTQRHLKQWVRSRRWHADWKFFPSKCAITPQPKGVVGIMAPWNYPFNLVMEPLVAAIAAGNRVMVKPSEITGHTAALIKTMLAEVFADDEVHVVLGDATVANAFSALPLDHILFTGSTQVGKIIMRNASDNLTPVTLELGGKSPVLIDHKYPIKRAAKAIAQGKWFNAGQTCLAPDYVLIDAARMEALVEAISQVTTASYPNPADNRDYSCVVNPHHHQRLQQLLDGIPNEQIHHLGTVTEGQKMAPTLVLNPPLDHPIMRQEIFGPILPIITCEGLAEQLAFINQRDRPLTLYLFSNRQAVIKQVRDQTHSGSLTVNETLVQFAQQGLPFGGIGASGMGSYHGYQGFLAMSHMKSTYYQSRLNLNGLVRAPYTRLKQSFIQLLNR
ncbi:coniferyl aldehyde dehydrogenase [Marinicella meishanensis]|uniref:coniferyl aldehyde dehydrogenase n=1 Tax=Marinicella meishanensis TaxID=2873263 RepID=UPI001CC0EB19|nr:coniferyl aldehyde dehydrogenase [Marinicella sp. NBU2979]